MLVTHFRLFGPANTTYASAFVILWNPGSPNSVAAYTLGLYQRRLRHPRLRKCLQCHRQALVCEIVD